MTRSVEVSEPPRFRASLREGKWYVIDDHTDIAHGPYWNAPDMAAYWNEHPDVAPGSPA